MRRASVLLDQQIMDEARAQRMVIKLLLLGAGESGKSTFFKQAISLYGLSCVFFSDFLYKPKLAGKDHSVEDRKLYIPAIISNILTSMIVLIKHSEKLNVFVAPENHLLAEHTRLEIEQSLGAIDSLWPRIVPNLVCVLRAFELQS